MPRKATAEAKKTKKEIIDTDFREVTDTETPDTAETESPTEDVPEDDGSKLIDNLMNKYKIAFEENQQNSVLVDIYQYTTNKLTQDAKMGQDIATRVAANAMDTIVSGIASAVKSESKNKKQADRLLMKEQKMEKKIQLSKERRNQILYGFGAPGIYQPTTQKGGN